MQEELWSEMVTALGRSSDRRVPEALALSTFTERLLPACSRPSLPALRAALSALGHPVALQELQRMPHAELQRHVRQVSIPFYTAYLRPDRVLDTWRVVFKYQEGVNVFHLNNTCTLCVII